MALVDLPPTRKLRVTLGDPSVQLAYWVLAVGDELDVESESVVNSYLRDLVARDGLQERTSKAYAGWLSIPVRYRLAREWSWEDMAQKGNFSDYLRWRVTYRRDTKGRGATTGASRGTINAEIKALTRLYLWGAREQVIATDAAGLMIKAAPASPWSDSDQHSAVEYAPAWKVSQGSPAADKALRRAREQRKAMTDDEFVALMRVARNARDRYLLVLLRSPGLRVGGLVSLKRHLIHVHQREEDRCQERGPHLHVHPQHDHPDGIKHPDGFTLPLSSWSNDFYFDWLAERRTIPEARNTPWLFVSLPGSPRNPPGQLVTSSAVRALLTRLCIHAGIPHRHPHQLRHRVGERAVELGIAPEVLQELRGDRSLAGQNSYRKASPESKILGIEALAAELPALENL